MKIKWISIADQLPNPHRWGRCYLVCGHDFIGIAFWKNGKGFVHGYLMENPLDEQGQLIECDFFNKNIMYWSESLIDFSNDAPHNGTFACDSKLLQKYLKLHDKEFYV